MVSFQALMLPPISRETAVPEVENSTNKRKRPEEPNCGTNTTESLEKRSKSLFDIELHLETPLPLEWQRCLDIQSGQIHFYNTRTHKRTSRDPRRSPEPASPSDHLRDHHHRISLDLDLNLSCDSLNNKEELVRNKKQGNNNSLPWMAVAAEEEEEEQMVATVCMRCHMLVMLCKSSPSCPNCKFMHRVEEGYEPKLFKQRLGLLC